MSKQSVSVSFLDLMLKFLLALCVTILLAFFFIQLWWPAIATFLAENWLLMSGIGGIVVLGASAHKTIPAGWRAFKAIHTHQDERRLNTAYYELLAQSKVQMAHGYEIDLVNGRTGDRLKVNNPFARGRGGVSIEEIQEIIDEKLILPETIARTQIEVPSQDRLLGVLVPNSLTVSPGIRNSNGEPVVVSITEIPHLKIIGASGFGKSCLAAALLDQACQLNTPDKLQIALLDLEHKTSRLFEDRANVAEISLGNRRVTMVATDADEVAQHLGYLKRELSRRTKLSEHDLQKEPVLLMYVEEMLSLQFEVDEELLQQMLADITVLAIRGRKYGMFLLAVSQTDYSTQELKTAQKQFRFRAAAAIDTTAARAAGFMNTSLIKDNFQHGKPGQFVVEYPSFSDLVLSPNYDVKKLVLARAAGIQEIPVPISLRIVNSEGTGSVHGQNTSVEQPLQANLEQVRALRVQNWGKINIIEKVWGVKRGGSQAYKDACVEYDTVVGYLDVKEEVGGN